ncbi:SMI1/KNR4 family protein [Actinomycetota bacterium Odt1-20B]
MSADPMDPVDIAAFTTAHPERPPAPVAVDWAAVERWLGLTLPDDYKRLADAHGPLDFGEYLWIHVPCAEESRFDYGEWLRETHRETRIAARRLPDAERPAVHPEPGGLLAWGTSRGGDTLYWDTSASADPNAWTVVVRHQGAVPGSGLEPWHPYELTLTGYLRHTVRDGWELPCPPGPLLGPLPGSAARTAFLPTAAPWTPPAPTGARLSEAQRRTALDTGTGLDALTLLTAPPATPYLGGGSWQELYEELGTRLPREYVTLMERYGAGCWSHWLRFLTPLRTAGGKRYADHIATTRDAYGQLKSGFPESFPLAVWPEPGGFLPFANSVDGDEIGWLTRGDTPDDWPLIVWPRHADQGPPLEQGLVDTLLAWQRGTFDTEGLPGLDEDDDPVECAVFEAWDERAYW